MTTAVEWNAKQKFRTIPIQTMNTHMRGRLLSKVQMQEVTNQKVKRIYMLKCTCRHVIYFPKLIRAAMRKPGLRGFRPGPTQTGLYSHRRRPEASISEFKRRYYPSSENKMQSQHDLCLCFRICIWCNSHVILLNYIILSIFSSV